MINALSLMAYRVKAHKGLGVILLCVVAVMGLQLANVLLMKLLGLNNPAFPLSFITVIQNGFFITTAIAFVMVACPLVAVNFWIKGGVKRAIAGQLLLYWAAFILMSWLGFYAFILWQGLNLQPYPWLITAMAIRMKAGSEGMNHLIISLFASYSLFALALVAKLFSAKTKAEKVFGSAHFSSAFELQRAGLFSEEGIVLGKAYGKRLRLPGYEGALVVAPMGGGKTTAIAIPNLLEWNGSGVFNDLKGELYRETARYRQEVLENECFLWAPTDRAGQTVSYNPFFYVSDNPDYRIRDLQLIAQVLIPATKQGIGFWYQSSRELFLTLSLYFLETKGAVTLTEIHDISKQKKFFVWLEKEIMKNEHVFSKFLKQNAYAILGAHHETQTNILKDFHSRTGLFNDPVVGYATSKNDFDFRELRRKKMSIYIHIPDGDKERLSPLLTLFWAQLLDVMSAKEPGADEPYGVLALMDEFGNMERINKLKDGMSFLRSYHIRSIIIVQYLAQIISVYGRDDAKGFLNSKVKIAFALNDIDDAQFFSKALGSKTVKVTSSSVNTGHGDRPGSRSQSVSYRARALMSPDELMQLSHKKEIILIEAKNPVKANKCYWFKEVAYRYGLNQLDAGNDQREVSDESST